MIQNGWTEEIERLRLEIDNYRKHYVTRTALKACESLRDEYSANNKQLVEACRAIQAAHPLREGQTKRGGALGLVDTAIQKAVTP